MKLLKFITFSNKSFYQRESELQIASKKKNEQVWHCTKKFQLDISSVNANKSTDHCRFTK